MHSLVEAWVVDQGFELLHLHELRVCHALVVPQFCTQLVKGELWLLGQRLQVWQDTSVLQKCDEHEVNAEAVKALLLVREVPLVPSFEVESQLNEAQIIGSVGANKLRV